MTTYGSADQYGQRVFAQPRPGADLGWIKILQCQQGSHRCVIIAITANEIVGQP